MNNYPATVVPSRLQRLMLAGQALAPESPFYNMAFSFDLGSDLDSQRFASSVASVVQSNELMRWRIDRDGSIVTADAAERLEFELLIVDCGDDSIDVVRTRIAEQATLTLPTHEQLFETCLYRCRGQNFIWYVNFHHIITDAAAFSLFYDHVQKAYSGEAFEVEAYDRYLRYEQQSLNSDVAEKTQSYWANKCANWTASSEQSFSRSVVSAETERQSINLDLPLMRVLKSSVKSPALRSLNEDLSIFSVFAAILLLLRYRLFDPEAQTLGCPLNKRVDHVVSGPSIEIGFVAIDISSDMTFSELVKAVQLDSFESMKHCAPGISNSQINSSFTWLLNFLNNKFGDFAQRPSASRWLHAKQGDAAHELRLQVHDFDSSGVFTLLFDLQTRVFNLQQRKRIPHLFVTLLEQCLAQPDSPISSFSLAAGDDLSPVYGVMTAAPMSPIATFEQIATETPRAIALSNGEVEISYDELNEAASTMAIQLRELEVAPLLLPRSLDVVVVLLAALKAKIPFVPMDVDHPPARINSILDLLGTDTLITTVSVDTSEINAKNLVIIEHLKTSAVPGKTTTRRNFSDLAYIIFTSGTTGVPKGVSIAHPSFNNYLSWASCQYADDQPVSMPLFSSLAFDLTLTSIFLPLITGGVVRVYEQQHGAQLDVLKVFDDDQVDFVKLTPSHLKLVLNSTDRASAVRGRRLRGLILGGENLHTLTALKSTSILGPNVRLFNEYGPTEATIGCMIHQFDAGSDTLDSVPIGKPIQGAKLELLDYCGQAVPRGFDGELYVSGAVLAQDYWQGASITGSRYKTGDLARRLDTENYVYLGRTDSQTKFRGARIELFEIESALRANPILRDVAVRVFDEQQNLQTELCRECGISSNVPGIQILPNGWCNDCEKFKAQRSDLQEYFKSIAQLQQVLGEPNGDNAEGCLALASGGKDSSYMVCKLVELGYKPIVFTLDNGYLSEHALANVERITTRLGLQWIKARPDNMNIIFSDSLTRHSNVCDGCFKTIYTLAINYAVEHGIKHIVTGLSRGQLFETRLIDMLDADVLNEDLIDQRVKSARIAYHQIDDAISETLDVSHTRSRSTFDAINFVDFYRYTDVELADMYHFLESYGDWQRPPDTGRSTNCLINDVGIHVHKQERGHHNYAVPYAWDVRMGHKTRQEAVDELNDDIDARRVEEILKDIGYKPKQHAESEQQLVAYVCLKSGHNLSNLSKDLRQSLRGVLPEYAIPTVFIELDVLPLNVSGKLDTAALPKYMPGVMSGKLGEGTAPTTEIESMLLGIWQRQFGDQGLGTTDDFFAIGGDSIKAVQITADCLAMGINVVPTDLFVHTNIVELAKVATLVNPESSYSSKLISSSGLAEDELTELLGRMEKRT